MDTKLFYVALEGMATGCDPIEDASRNGGIFVDDETLALVTDLETVAMIGFDGNTKKAIRVLLQVMKNAPTIGDDPLEAARDWLDGWLDLAAIEGAGSATLM